jgi:hypothetical protein
VQAFPHTAKRRARRAIDDQPAASDQAAAWRSVCGCLLFVISVYRGFIASEAR